jgi:hypothetical protein
MLASLLNLFLQLGLVAVIVRKLRKVLRVIVKHFIANDLRMSLALDIHQSRVWCRHFPVLDIPFGLID